MGFPNLAGSSPAMGYPGPSPALARPGTGAALALPGPGAGHSASMAAPTFGNVGASVFGQAAMNPTFGHTGFGPNVGNPAAFGHAAMTAVGHPGITGVHPAPAAVGHGGPSAAFGHGGPSAAFGHAGVYPAAVPKAAFGHAGVHPAASGHPGSSPGFGMAGPSPGFGMAGPSPTPAPLPLQWGKDDANVKKPPSRVLKEHKTI